MSASVRHLLLVPAVAALLGLAACGSDDDPPAAGGGTTAAAPASTAARAATPAGDPEERLEAVADAMGGVRSMHFEGTSSDDDGERRISGDLTSGGDAQFRLSGPDEQAEIRVVGDDAYIRANAAFFAEEDDDAEDRAAREQLDGRWVQLPVTASGLDRELRTLLPSTLAKCLTTTNGTLRDGGTGDVDGRAALVLEDRGDRPGTAPGRLFYAAEGAPLPLRILQTGPSRSGGEDHPECGDDDDSTTRSDVRLSRFDEPVTVTAPRGALRIPVAGDEPEATT